MPIDTWRSDLPDPGIKPTSPAFQEDSLPTEPSGKLIIGERISSNSVILALGLLLTRHPESKKKLNSQAVSFGPSNSLAPEGQTSGPSLPAGIIEGLSVHHQQTCEVSDKTVWLTLLDQSTLARMMGDRTV